MSRRISASSYFEVIYDSSAQVVDPPNALSVNSMDILYGIQMRS